MQLASRQAPAARVSSIHAPLQRNRRPVQARASAAQKPHLQAQDRVRKAIGVALAAGAALQLTIAGPSWAAIGGSGTPFGPKPDAGRETADLYGESSGGPASKQAYQSRSSLGGQSSEGPTGTSSRSSKESSTREETAISKIDPLKQTTEN